jgi:SAM-dependent methyltransferase
VLCTQVLEHVDEPDAVLGELARVLRPGGVVLMSTHGVFHHHPYPHDYWRWTHEGLTRIMSRHFERPKIYAQGGTMLLMAHLMGRGVYSVAGKRWWLRWLRYTAYPVVNLMGLLLDRMVPDQSVSINYLVVAWKPAVGSARAAGG